MIEARLVDCDETEAFLLAVKANTLHGKPLSRAERMAAVRRTLAGIRTGQTGPSPRSSAWAQRQSGHCVRLRTCRS